MRVGDAQVLVGIHRDIVDADFVMKVGPGRASAVADITDGVAAMHVLSGINRKALHMAIASRDSVAVIENDRSSISAHEVCEFNDSVCRGHDWLSIDRADIHA